MSRNRPMSFASEVLAGIRRGYRLSLEKFIRRDGHGHFPRFGADEIRQCENRAIDHPDDHGDNRQKAEQTGHRRASLTIEIIQHVRPAVARDSGLAIGGGSIGGLKERRVVRQLSNGMPETVSPAGVGASREAEILAALGTRLIVLVGMMGAGKSTVGRRLAGRLGVPFVDADSEIEAAAGMSIPDIFEAHGEPQFRDGEARVIARLLESGPAVLATGGGAFMREETRKRIGAKAISIWLKADADIIMRRVRRRADRPLLQTPDPEATLGRLISEREPV